MSPPHLISISFLLLIHLTSTQASSSAQMAKPGCQTKCGNLSIPYPFGIGKGCYLDHEFEVTCNKSTNLASLSLVGGLNIYNISTEYVAVEAVNSPFLFNQSTGENLDGSLLGSSLLPSKHYNFSSSKNKLVAMGCDVFAYIKDRTSGEIISECASLCRHDTSSPLTVPLGPQASCSGHGCCESLNISGPMTNFSAMMHTMNTLDRSWVGSGCNFLLIVDRDFSDYGRINVSDCDRSYELPLVLDWTVSDRSCGDEGTATICGLNSDCVNHSGRRGYSCHCKVGYEGNPYLQSGCQDINECEGRNGAKHNCSKNAYCVNTPGSYSCNCLSGYHDTADGCILDQQRHTWILYLCLGIGLSIGFLVMIVLGFWLHKELKRRKQAKVKKQFFRKNGGLLLEQQISFNKGSVADTQVFTIEELEKATDNFNVGRILGKGGLGTVYKGMLPDGSIVALKKPNQLNEKEIDQFINEIFILSQINHRNIVKVLGCCLEVQIPMVVYEYVPNGNLSYYLHGRRHTDDQKRSLSWMDRHRIAAEVAGALAYLHSCASMAIFHRDIKSSNILLDENFRAVVSDFGLSKSVPVDKTHLTTTVGGTFGYLDPEYFRSGQLNDKSDVYAFGVVLAELLTGRKVIPTEKNDECLVSRFVSLTKQDRAFEILDKQIVEDGEEEEIMAVVKIARKCLKWSSRKRPGMKEVAAELDRLRKTTMGKGKGSVVSPVRSMGDEYYCSFSHSFETCAAMEDSSEESIYSVDAASSFLK
ncbi:wall-associated receptor kinase 2-like isoform X2 [Ipomoea triloba]|uniref:wall-associated receptor kinase 2-like isoform X2 n=1 Tax=Ipomoea triloba TaxID=35885 RepID=UPI00125D3D41|nr:wall-associated receptor kinase 2-like isoform X2 [Ipomoea triloba]